MGKKVNPLSWIAMASAATSGLVAYWAQQRADEAWDEFEKKVRQPGITDPRKVWRICSDYHRKLKQELVQAQAKIQAGEEIVRVGVGLMKIRKDLEKNSRLPYDLKIKQWMGEEISEEELKAAEEMMSRKAPDPMVTNAIIAHWWSELMQLFVPWGIIVPEEIESAQKPFFRLVDPDDREATLRMEVYKYKHGYEYYRKKYDDLWDATVRSRKDTKPIQDLRDKWKKALNEAASEEPAPSAETEVSSDEEFEPVSREDLEEQVEKALAEKAAWKDEREELLDQIDTLHDQLKAAREARLGDREGFDLERRKFKEEAAAARAQLEQERAAWVAERNILLYEAGKKDIGEAGKQGEEDS